MRTMSGLVQGSEEWLAHRRTTRNASDAPAMMGVSPHVSRSDLIKQYATGIQREIDESTQRRFDRGHEVEPALRAFAEGIIGEDFYPITGVTDDGYLGASFDGVNLDETIILEAKQSNAEKIASVSREQIPKVDYWQVVQQFAVCLTATQAIYAVGDGSKEGTVWLAIRREDIEHDIPKLMASWRQFDADVAAYQPESQAAPVAAGRAPTSLPALSVVAKGMVEFSNVDEFRQNALAAIAAVNRDLQTDEDFATAELTVKAFKAGEEKLEATKAQVLGQMADVDAVMRTIDEVSEQLRQTRLSLDKLVTAEKEKRRAEIVERGRKAVVAHYETTNATLGAHALSLPAGLVAELGASIKGKKTVASLNEAVDSAVANFKIAASQRAEQVRANIHAFEMEVGDYGTLFPDRVTLCATKAPEDLRNLIVMRIAEHKEAEQARQDKTDQAKRDADAPAAAKETEQPAVPAVAVKPTTTPAKKAVSAHTPGPWTYKLDGQELSIDGVLWTGSFGDVGGCPNEYDARLIAAAPELLEALKAVLSADLYADGEGLVSFAYPNTVEGEAAAEIARRAIAKATQK